MNRVEAVNDRYAASAAMARNGAEVIAAGDPPGARLSAAVQRLLVAVDGDGPGLWDNLVGAAKALRWRRITQPQPIAFNAALRAGAEEVARQASFLRGAMGDDLLLNELGDAALAVAVSDSFPGELLLRSIEETGYLRCAVVAASRPARAGLEGWLGGRGVLVATSGGLERLPRRVEQLYVAGPPRFFKSSLVTAPVASEITFVTPAWFRDRAVPASAIAPYAEGAIRIAARISTEGDVSESESAPEAVGSDDDFLLRPAWDPRPSLEREPTSSEVEARKVLLSGNLAMWLDDGERIRTLEPDQPAGKRVTYTSVRAVRAGTYLLLRQGDTERGVLYQMAMDLLTVRRSEVLATQRQWKALLTTRLSVLGYPEVVRQLTSQGVRSGERARAWTDPNLVRPHSDQDFERLLGWLGIPIQPTFGRATQLRRMLYRASAGVRDELEAAVSGADLSVLERSGYLRLDVSLEGLRGILATRVLAISPDTEIKLRQDARVPFYDRSGQWLE